MDRPAIITLAIYIALTDFIVVNSGHTHHLMINVMMMMMSLISVTPHTNGLLFNF